MTITEVNSFIFIDMNAQYPDNSDDNGDETYLDEGDIIYECDIDEEGIYIMLFLHQMLQLRSSFYLNFVVVLRLFYPDCIVDMINFFLIVLG